MPASILSPNDFGFDSAGREISTFNPELAMEHIEASGLETPIAITLSFENNRFWPQLAELVKNDLDAVGFDVTLEPLDANTFWGRVNNSETQLTINQRSTFIPDPDDKANILSSSINGGASNLGALPSTAELDALITSGIAEQDSDARLDIYQQIQALALEEMPYIYLGYLTPPVVVGRDVQNVPVDAAAAGRATFAQVWIEN
jgi:peptide/nickel transport system substrate-binding protein